MITYLSVGLPTDVVALVIIIDDTRMLILVQDGTQYEIVKTILEQSGFPDHPGLIVITRRH